MPYFFSLMVFLKVDYEHNTLTGLSKREGEKREGHEEGGRERDTFLMATRLVMKHTVHKPHTMELFQKDF